MWIGYPSIILASVLIHCFHVVCQKVMRILEALEGKGFRLPLMKGEADLAEKLAAITRQVFF